MSFRAGSPAWKLWVLVATAACGGRSERNDPAPNPRPDAAPLECSSGYDDCNGDTGDGCETELSTSVESCGACGRACLAVNATALCVEGACETLCDDGYADCDGAYLNGCETSLDSDRSCGRCGFACEGGLRCRNRSCSS